jgi:flagellin
MTRINTNVVSLTAQRNLAVANESVSTSLKRLSTGLKINTGKDNPAGLIASERLRSEMVALESAISNNTRASNLIATAEASLAEINGLLLDVQGLVDTAANSGGMTVEEIAANQLLVDEAVDSITRIADTATFNGKKLLDGSLGGFSVSDNNAAKIDSVDVTSAEFAGTEQKVTVAFGHAANEASKAYLLMDATDLPIASVTGQVIFTGNLGSATVDFGATGTYNITQMVAMINDQSDATGVVATENAGDIELRSAEYGDQQFISVGLVGAAAFTTEDAAAAAATTDFGTDAVIVGVDLGLAAGTDLTGVTVEGLDVTVNRADLQMVIHMDETEATAHGAGDSSTFTITAGGGAKFQIGAEISSSNQITVAIDNVDADHLGSDNTNTLSTLKSGGINSLDKADLSTAADVVASAISTVSNLRGRLGAVQANTLETQISSLGTTLENVTSAESIIRDTDFAEETANLTRAQILVQAGTSVLAMANSSPQSVLSLLQG